MKYGTIIALFLLLSTPVIGQNLKDVYNGVWHLSTSIQGTDTLFIGTENHSVELFFLRKRKEDRIF